jgi:hypothetical protein
MRHMDEEQREAFKKAVERKKQRAAGKATRSHEEAPPPTIEAHAPGDRGEQSIRTKSTGHSRER